MIFYTDILQTPQQLYKLYFCFNYLYLYFIVITNYYNNYYNIIYLYIKSWLQK